MQRFNWNDIRFFLEVARAGTLSGAARALGTDHATVSRRVGGLELTLKLRLFHRSPIGYMLTPDGEALLAHAESMEELALKMAESSGDVATALSGAVRLSTPDGFGNFYFARHMGRFAEKYPRLHLQLIPVQQVLSLSQREGDVLVSLSRPAHGRFHSEKLCDYHLGLYAGRNYLDSRPEIRNRADLKGHRLIGYVDDLIFSRELDYHGELQLAQRAGIQSASLAAQLVAARAGAGVCILPHFIARAHADLVPVLESRFSLLRAYWINLKEDTRDLPRVRALYNFVMDTISEYPLND